MMKRILDYIKNTPCAKYIIGSLLAFIIIASGFVALKYLNDNKKNVTEKFSLYIAPQTSVAELLDTLNGKLKSVNSFLKCLKRENPTGTLACGYYLFNKNTTNKAIARAITKGWQTPYRLTLSGNIRGLEKLAGLLGKRMMHDSTAFITYFNTPEVWAENGLKKETFATLFIPNTYEIYWNYTPEEFTKRMRREYDKFWTTARIEKAKELGMSREEISTLASIVCEESNYAPELATIAGVYLNRLKIGMRLEADPTVKFAMNDPGIKRILYKHLKVDSPYNTYRIYGLPPGPITIPSVAGIDAVLNYQKHNYLYFCANEKLDGTHKFARTLSEHNRNARAYQAAISKHRLFQRLPAIF